MARVTKTTYVCDGCDKTVENAKGLRKFHLQQRSRREWLQASADLCADCETTFLYLLGTDPGYFNGEEIAAMKRDS